MGKGVLQQYNRLDGVSTILGNKGSHYNEWEKQCLQHKKHASEKCVWFVTGNFIAAIVTQCNDLKMFKSLL